MEALGAFAALSFAAAALARFVILGALEGAASASSMTVSASAFAEVARLLGVEVERWSGAELRGMSPGTGEEALGMRSSSSDAAMVEPGERAPSMSIVKELRIGSCKLGLEDDGVCGDGFWGCRGEAQSALSVKRNGVTHSQDIRNF